MHNFADSLSNRLIGKATVMIMTDRTTPFLGLGHTPTALYANLNTISSTLEMDFQMRLGNTVPLFFLLTQCGHIKLNFFLHRLCLYHLENRWLSLAYQSCQGRFYFKYSCNGKSPSSRSTLYSASTLFAFTSFSFSRHSVYSMVF